MTVGFKRPICEAINGRSGGFARVTASGQSRKRLHPRELLCTALRVGILPKGGRHFIRIIKIWQLFCLPPPWNGRNLALGSLENRSFSLKSGVAVYERSGV
jgi:hypothetical protein